MAQDSDKTTGWMKESSFDCRPNRKWIPSRECSDRPRCSPSLLFIRLCQLFRMGKRTPMLTICFHLSPRLRIRGTPPLISHTPSCFAWAQLLLTYISVMSVPPPKGQCQHLNDSTLFFFLSQKFVNFQYDLSLNSDFWPLMVSVERTLPKIINETLCVFSGLLKIFSLNSMC